MAAEVTLQFLSGQVDRVLARLGAMEQQMTAQTAAIARLDASVSGLTREIRAMNRILDRADTR